MEKVAINAVRNEPHDMGIHSVRRYVSDALNTDNLAMVYYELEPGERFSGGLHTHHDQEEVFYILAGTVTVEYTLDRKTIVLDAGEAIRFAPGEFQCGRNRSEERVRATALGAPVPASSAKATKWVTMCERCESETLHGIRSHDAESTVSYCMTCGNEFSLDERRN